MAASARGWAGGAPRRPEPDDAWRARCGACGSVIGRGAWSALPLLETLPSAGVRAHLSVAADWSIEVRRCTCGTSLARRSPP